tara:strand:- start:660 stop:764 length:105 start_codon:yes stop_codon:yes gene_type:complete
MSDEEKFVEWFRNTHPRVYNDVYTAYTKAKEMKK